MCEHHPITPIAIVLSSNDRQMVAVLKEKWREDTITIYTLGCQPNLL